MSEYRFSATHEHARRQKSLPRRSLNLLRSSLRMFDKPNLTVYPVYGVDTSLWTGRFNWKLFRERGGSFGILKALDGIYVDPQFEWNYKAAKDAGVLISTYQWLYSRLVTSTNTQGRAYAQLLKNYPVDFAPSVDFERNRINPNSTDLWGHVKTFEDVYGDRPMIYTGYYFWEEQGSPGPTYAEYLLWLAWFYKLNPAVPKPFKRWQFHQFTDRADGIYWGSPANGENELDFNYFNGSQDEFLAFCNKQVTPPTPPVTPPEPPIVVQPQPPGMVFSEVWFGKVRHDVHTIAAKDLTYHILRMKIEDIEDVVFDDRVAVSTTTSFLARKNVDLAINGLEGFCTPPGKRRVTRLGTLDDPGFAAYHGRAYGKLGYAEVVYVDKLNRFSLGKPQNIWSACSFPNCLIREGLLQKAAFRDPKDVRARTAIGISSDATTLIILVVDGGDYWVKKGMNFLDTAKVLQEEGAWLGIMADGGGSTTLVRKGEDGKPYIVNVPCGEDKTTHQRPVAIHMGLKIRR